MPADKPRGAFSQVDADLDCAFEYDRPSIGDTYPGYTYASEIGGILSDLNSPGIAEARAAPHLIGTDGSGKHNLDGRPVATGPQTFAIGLVLRSSSGTNDVFIGIGDTSAGFNFLGLDAVGTHFFGSYMGGSDIALNGGAALSVGDFVAIVLTTAGSTTTILARVYVNNVLAGSTTLTAGNPADFGELGSAGKEINPEGNWSLVFRRYYSRAKSVADIEADFLAPGHEPYADVGASGGASSLALPLASRSRAGQAIGAAAGAVELALPLASRARAAQAITVQAGAAGVALPLASRTRAAQAITVQAGAAGVALPLASRTRAAQAITASTQGTLVVPLASRTRAAQAITVQGGPIELSIPLASRARAAQPIGVTTTGRIVLPLASRTRTGQAITASVGTATVALPLAARARRALPLFLPGSVPRDPIERVELRHAQLAARWTIAHPLALSLHVRR